MTTITDCLNNLFRADGGPDPSPGDGLLASAGGALSACAELPDEYRQIKRQYFRLIRTHHPDKGGDTDAFRKIQASFEIIRKLYEARAAADGITSFTDPTVQSRTVDAEYSTACNGVKTGSNAQPWEFYEAADDVDEPPYHVETAKSSQSRCSQKSSTYRRCDQEGVTQTDKKSGREVEVMKNAKIAKGEVRVGSLIEETGSYGRWMHIECWRVPSKIWLGCPEAKLGPQGADEEQLKLAAAGAAKSTTTSSSPSTTTVSTTLYDQYEAALMGMNEVFLSGLTDLNDKDRREFVSHVMDRCNWAKIQKRKKAKKDANASAETSHGVAVPGLGGGGKKPSPDSVVASDALVTAARAAQATSPSTSPREAGAMVANAIRKDRFVPPVPGIGKGVDNALAGLKFVLTGTFPELGGGSGIGLGKTKAQKMIKAFGGTTTGGVSGKTSYLLVGKDPGMSKVSKANEKGVPRLNLQDLKALCEGGDPNDIKPIQITSFSKGFGNGNGLALKASAEEMMSAAAAQPADNMITGGKDVDMDTKPAAKRAPKKKSAPGKSKAKQPAKKGSGGAKKKTIKAKKEEAKAAAAKKASEEKDERKARVARSKERKETPMDQLDWQHHLEINELQTESVKFLQGILKHEGLKVSGKKADLIERLREHAGLDEGVSDTAAETSDSSTSESDDMEVENDKEEMEVDAVAEDGDLRASI